MKLDYKKTAKVGLAFAIIILFWSIYDFVMPLLIDRAFGLSNFWRGVIMGLDNLLSLFMLPLFGKLSDNSKSKYGRRTPYIVLGTVAAVLCMVFIPVSAKKQVEEANVVRTGLEQQFATDKDFREAQLADWYDKAASGDYTYITHIDFTTFSDKSSGQYISRDEYIAIYQTQNFSAKKDGFLGLSGDTVYKITNADGTETVLTAEEGKEIQARNTQYSKFVANGVNTYINGQVETQITMQNKGRLVSFLVVVFIVLVAMGTFRSPAVALMPDVTPKPLRSQANAIINLAGGIGGAIAFIIYTVAFMINENAFLQIYLVGGGCMLLLLVLFLHWVKEPRFVEECRVECEKYGVAYTDEDEEAAAKASDAPQLSDEDKKKLQKAKFKSFLLILASIFMWFMGYNAVSSNMSVYATRGLNLSAGIASIISGVSMGISAIAFIPVGALAVKIGRRKSIILGFALAVVSYALIYIFLRPSGSAAVLFSLFYLISGFGLIIANVNTFPMVVELSSAKDVGKYTGFYYMATMSAQSITPAIAGAFMDAFSLKALFVYSAVCVIFSIVLMSFVKHGDSKPLPKKSKLENFDVDD